MRTLFTALVLLLAAGGVWWFLGDGDEPVGSTPSPSGAVVASPAPDPRESTSQPVTPSLRDAIESPPAPAGFVFRIKVVCDEDGVPVGGAELGWVVKAQTTGTGRSDGNGLATIRHGERRLRVHARSSELFANDVLLLEGALDSGDFELRLRRDVTVVLLLLDEADVPVPGVRVVVTADDAQLEASFPASDASGRITAQHVQTMLQADASYRVVAATIGPPGASTPLRLDPPPIEPVIVRVPSCANLEIVALDADGAPWPFVEGERATVFASTAESSRGHGAEFDSHGVARLTGVRCGAKVTLSWFRSSTTQVSVTAPERAGETKRVELRVPAEAPVLTGRFVSLDGAVLRDEIELQIEGPGEGGNLRVVTDASGVFRVVSSVLRAGTTPNIQAGANGHEDPPRRLIGEVPLTRPLTGGVNDLGDIALAPAPELVRGRVEWSDGSPVLETLLHVSRERRRDNWSMDATIRIDLAEDGSFVAWGLADQRRCRIHASVRELAVDVEPIEFVPGARDVVIRLERGATVEANFLVDDDTPWRSFQFTLARTTPSTTPAQHRITNPDKRRLRSKWSMVAAGSYRVLVEMPGTANPLLAIDGLEVVAGRACDDPRLRDIDLRGLAQRCVLEIFGPDDQPIAEPAPTIRPAPGTRSLSSSSLGPGRFEIPLTAPIDVIIEAQGYIAQEHRAVAGRARVRMAKAADYQLRCTASLPPETSFAVSLRRIDPATNRAAGSGRDLAPLALESQEPVSWAPSTSDGYELTLLVRRDRVRREGKAFTPTRIDVRTLVPGQIIEIVPDPAALAAALAELKD